MPDSAKKPAEPPPGPIPEWALRYDASEFPRYAVTGDSVAFTLDWRGGEAALQALLIVRHGEPFKGLDAWPGGFIVGDRDPTTRETALRELEEETGMAEPGYVEPLGSYTQFGRDPRQF